MHSRQTKDSLLVVKEEGVGVGMGALEAVGVFLEALVEFLEVEGVQIMEAQDMGHLNPHMEPLQINLVMDPQTSQVMVNLVSPVMEVLA